MTIASMEARIRLMKSNKEQITELQADVWEYKTNQYKICYMKTAKKLDETKEELQSTTQRLKKTTARKHQTRQDYQGRQGNKGRNESNRPHTAARERTSSIQVGQWINRKIQKGQAILQSPC
ncbi:hypothetical protein OS493_016659 [Desmophyllum pertusum]|uniref:Uncharacterized protein n=1 Tax=Desmophyllum pertusum TaxID=174260 RepID=A0A9X0CXC0_9CNID|nr:hypothetical protein OS493_016659 [Desmophyllum pertusum]